MTRDPKIAPRLGDILRKGDEVRTVYGTAWRAGDSEDHILYQEMPVRFNPFRDEFSGPTESQWREWAKDAEVLAMAFELPRPFANGSQFMDWQENNCSRCSRNESCDIQSALWHSYMMTGQVTHEIARRMGYSDPLVYGWRCGEFVEATH